MRRIRVSLLVACVAAAAALVLAGPIGAAQSTSIVGTWSGYLTPASGSHASRQRLTVVFRLPPAHGHRVYARLQR